MMWGPLWCLWENSSSVHFASSCSYLSPKIRQAQNSSGTHDRKQWGLNAYCWSIHGTKEVLDHANIFVFSAHPTGNDLMNGFGWHINIMVDPWKVSTVRISLPTISCHVVHLNFGSTSFFGPCPNMRWKNGFTWWISHKYHGGAHLASDPRAIHIPTFSPFIQSTQLGTLLFFSFLPFSFFLIHSFRLNIYEERATDQENVFRLKSQQSHL